jgi:hypothetical protein
LFAYYKFPLDIYGGIVDPNADPVAAVTRHFDMVSGHMGYRVPPPEELVNHLGYHYLEGKSPGRAYPLFALNIKNYPNSANAYDSMGDYYSDQHDKAKAIEYYKKSLKLQNNPATQKKLEAVEK